MYTLGETLEDVAHAALDLATSSRLIVVGNSIGGSCALEVAAAAPDRVEHVVLVGTKPGHRPEPSYRDWALNLLEVFHGRWDLSHVIDSWPRPVTVVTGSEDVAPRVELSQETVRSAQQGVLRIVPDCGHYVPIEQPDAFARVLDEVIESTV